MDKFIQPALMGDNCDKKEELAYTKLFTEDELASFKDELAEIDIDIDEVEAEKKEATKGFNESLKDKRNDRTRLLKNIRQKSEFVKEECFKFIDHDAREVGYYNDHGTLVYQRPIRADEMQKSIFEVKRTGTHN